MWACAQHTLPAAPHAAQVVFLIGAEQEQRPTSRADCIRAAEISLKHVSPAFKGVRREPQLSCAGKYIIRSEKSACALARVCAEARSWCNPAMCDADGVIRQRLESVINR